MRLIDLTGERFGRLLVLSRCENVKYPSGKTGVVYLCVCDCGAQKKAAATALRSGRVKSCGCLQAQTKSEIHTKHGASRHRLHTTWTNMKQRCYNEKSGDFKHYGGRGITVCAEWKDDFSNFYNWAMAHGYSDSLTIDRIDVNMGYCPENCRWATMLEQRHNRRDTI